MFDNIFCVRNPLSQIAILEQISKNVSSKFHEIVTNWLSTHWWCLQKNHNVNYTNYLFSHSYFKVSMNTSSSTLHMLFSTSLDFNYEINFSNLLITLIILCTTRCHDYAKVRKPFIQVVHNCLYILKCHHSCNLNSQLKLQSWSIGCHVPTM